MQKHYEKMIQDTQERLIHSFRVQELDEKSPYYGGFYDDHRIVQAKYAIYRVASMIAVYCNEDSKFYQNVEVFHRIQLGLQYIRRVQHSNGLFDYVTCNFNSAPDTAFCVKKLLPVYEYLLRKQSRTVSENELKSEIEVIVKEGARGLLEGGFHTPNHRWAIASVLAKSGELFGDNQLTQGAFAYLKEGIDCNEDGEFSEKSAGNYNRINNDAMITLSEALKDASYEQYAIRNLRMMLTYWEPDDSIFTANSTRFDKDFLIFPKDYYMEYLKMGIKYQIPEFLGMCKTIFRIVEDKKITSPDFLIWLMLDPSLQRYEYEDSYIQPEFQRFYQQSMIFREHKGHFSYTVMGNKSNFLYFHDGTIKLEMKVAGSFCEHRAFKAETMEQMEDGTIHLHQTMHGWYYLPFEEKQDTSDWWKMDQAKRKKKMGPDMQIDVFVKAVPDGIDVRVKTDGVKGAPWRIETAFTGIECMASEHVMLPVNGSEVLVIKDPVLEAYNKKDSITIGPGFGEHRYTEGKEDSEAKTVGAATVYFTDYTEFDHTIQIRNKKDTEEKLLGI